MKVVLLLVGGVLIVTVVSVLVAVVDELRHQREHNEVKCDICKAMRKTR